MINGVVRETVRGPCFRRRIMKSAAQQLVVSTGWSTVSRVQFFSEESELIAPPSRRPCPENLIDLHGSHPNQTEHLNAF